MIKRAIPVVFLLALLGCCKPAKKAETSSGSDVETISLQELLDQQNANEVAVKAKYVGKELLVTDCTLVKIDTFYGSLELMPPHREMGDINNLSASEKLVAGGIYLGLQCRLDKDEMDMDKIGAIRKGVPIAVTGTLGQTATGLYLDDCRLAAAPQKAASDAGEDSAEQDEDDTPTEDVGETDTAEGSAMCKNDMDCKGERICIDGACKTSEKSGVGCKNDMDCKGERICINGFCEFPPEK